MTHRKGWLILRTAGRWFALATIVALAVNILRLEILRLEAQGVIHAVTPYYVALDEEGSGIRYITAVRSDGARMLGWDRHGGGKAIISKRQIEFPDGRRIVIDDAKHIRSTVRDPQTVHPFGLYLDPKASCLRRLDGLPENPTPILLWRGQTAGYRTVRVEDKRSALVRWMALDYGCATIQQEIGLGGGQVSKQVLWKLEGGEPSNLLFEVSDSYQEVPPSQIVPTVNDAAHDEYYRKHRP